MEEEKKCKIFNKEKYIPIIVTFVIGALLGVLAMYFITGGTTAIKVGTKRITKNDLYNKLKNYSSINVALEDVDKTILNKKYKLTEEEKDEIKKTAEYYISMYENYGYTKEAFLKENGFDDFDSFVDYLTIDYLRTVYYYETIEEQLDENVVEDYYNENAFGKVNTKHILVKTSDDVSEASALAIANEIIERLKAGEKFDDLANEYTEKYDYVITEDLGEKGAFDNLEEAYVQGMKELNKDEFSNTPVKTSYGFHVIYCVDKTEKTDVISRKDKMAIINVVGAEIISTDSEAYTKSLIKMREDAHVKFKDKVLNKKYEELCAEYVSNDAETQEEDIEYNDETEELNVNQVDVEE